MALQLETGKTYQVKILSIERMNKRPSYPYKGTTWYNYMMHVKILKDGPEGLVEFTSPHSEIDENLPFKAGIIQYMKCVSCKEVGCVVESFDPEPAPELSKLEMARKLADPNYKPPVPQHANSGIYNDRLLSMIGAWAKDVLVAEMEHKPEGYMVDDVQFSERWGRLTGLMNKELLEIVKQQQG